MKVYSRARSSWVDIPWRDMPPYLEPHKHLITLQCQTKEDQRVLQLFIQLLDSHGPEKVHHFLIDGKYRQNLADNFADQPKYSDNTLIKIINKSSKHED